MDALGGYPALADDRLGGRPVTVDTPHFARGLHVPLSALVHEYGDVSSGEPNTVRPFDTLRLRAEPVEVTGPSVLRDGATTPRLLRTSGIVARRAVSKGEWIRERIYEMLHLGGSAGPRAVCAHDEIDFAVQDMQEGQ